MPKNAGNKLINVFCILLDYLNKNKTNQFSREYFAQYYLKETAKKSKISIEPIITSLEEFGFIEIYQKDNIDIYILTEKCSSEENISILMTHVFFAFLQEKTQFQAEKIESLKNLYLKASENYFFSASSLKNKKTKLLDYSDDATISKKRIFALLFLILDYCFKNNKIGAFTAKNIENYYNLIFKKNLLPENIFAADFLSNVLSWPHQLSSLETKGLVTSVVENEYFLVPAHLLIQHLLTPAQLKILTDYLSSTNERKNNPPPNELLFFSSNNKRKSTSNKGNTTKNFKIKMGIEAITDDEGNDWETEEEFEITAPKKRKTSVSPSSAVASKS